MKRLPRPQSFGLPRASAPPLSVKKLPKLQRPQSFGIFNSCQAKMRVWTRMEIIGERIERMEVLGQGSYAEVCKGRALGIDCAVKVYRTTSSEKQREDAMREIRVMASLDHPCTLRLVGWTHSPLQMITELCSGDLEKFYTDKIEALPYTESQALHVFRVGCFVGMVEQHSRETNPPYPPHPPCPPTINPPTGNRFRARLPSFCRNHSPRYQTR